MLTSRQILIYFFITHEGKWKDIYTAIKDKEVIEDEAEAERVVNKFLSELPEGAFCLTQVDSDYPDWAKKLYHPPFVLTGTGDYSVLAENNLVFVESEEIGRSLKERISAMYVNSAGNLVITICKEDGTHKTGVFHEAAEDSLKRAAEKARKYLATDGKEDWVNLVLRTGEADSTYYAIPGNSGCACNSLIKQGWHLCDTWRDLADD